MCLGASGNSEESGFNYDKIRSKIWEHTSLLNTKMSLYKQTFCQRDGSGKFGLGRSFILLNTVLSFASPGGIGKSPFQKGVFRKAVAGLYQECDIGSCVSGRVDPPRLIHPTLFGKIREIEELAEICISRAGAGFKRESGDFWKYVKTHKNPSGP